LLAGNYVDVRNQKCRQCESIWNVGQNANFASRKDVPEHFVAMTTNLVHASINEVLIYLNIYWCLLFYNYKH